MSLPEGHQRYLLVVKGLVFNTIRRLNFMFENDKLKISGNDFLSFIGSFEQNRPTFTF